MNSQLSSGDVLKDKNIEEYAKWVPASELNNDYYIIKVKEG